jgi:hypothetical protein
VPLEVLVERRPARAHRVDELRALRLTVDAGLHFLRMLRTAALAQDYTDAFVTHFALRPPRCGRRGRAGRAHTRTFWRLAAGRALDARALEATIRAHGPAALAALPALGVAAGDRAEVRDCRDGVARLVRRRVRRAPGAAEDAWVPARLEYQCRSPPRCPRTRGASGR